MTDYSSDESYEDNSFPDEWEEYSVETQIAIMTDFILTFEIERIDPHFYLMYLHKTKTWTSDETPLSQTREEIELELADKIAFEISTGRVPPGESIFHAALLLVTAKPEERYSLIQLYYKLLIEEGYYAHRIFIETVEQSRKF